MNKKTWLLIAIITAIWICLFPAVVLGENIKSYNDFNSDTYYVSVVANSSGKVLKYKTSVNTRVLAYKTNNYVQLAFCSNQSAFTVYYMKNKSGSSGTGWINESLNTEYYGTYTSNKTYTSQDGTVMYYYTLSTSGTSGNSDLAIRLPISLGEKASVLSAAELYDYAYGANSEQEPTPEPIHWGILRDTSYTTRIAGSGQVARRNIDYLSWENTVDANGNDISECEVEIQAVYGKFTGNTINDLWETDVQDLAISGSVSLATVSASVGTYSVSWQKVIDDLNSFEFDSLFAHEVNQQIEKNGWYYQIRLISPDGYIGSWQTLYTPLSMGGKASETVITQNNFDMSVYQVYQDLSTINNNTSITITYIDTDYTINNPSDGTEPERGTNLWDVLKELINGVFQILAKLGDIVISLIDGLLDLFRKLFTPPDIVDNSINETFELNINNYIEENQNDLHQLNLHMKQFETDMKSLANQYGQGNISSCVITWEDVTIDLSLFSAGNVTLIEGGSYNFGDLFGSMINAFGISYDQYQFFVSGVIYICLIVFINKKIVWFLHNS